MYEKVAKLWAGDLEGWRALHVSPGICKSRGNAILFYPHRLIKDWERKIKRGVIRIFRASRTININLVLIEIDTEVDTKSPGQR